MGFRRPFCKADFGHDKDEFEKHMKEEKESPSIIEAIAATNLADTLKQVMKHVINPEDKII